MECCIGVSTETVLIIHNLYTVMKKVLLLVDVSDFSPLS